MTAHPHDFAVRPATLADAQPIADLINEVDLVDAGTADYSADEVTTDLTEPCVQIERDSWLAFEGDRLVAYGILWNAFGNQKLMIDHYVLPGSLPVGEHLIDLMVPRCAEAAAENGVPEGVVHLGLTPTSALAQGPLAERGWRTVRRFNQMVRPVSAEEDLPTVPPEGVQLRLASGEEDLRTVHRVIEESFAEHFGHEPLTFEQWHARPTNSVQFEWPLAWIASVDEPARDVAVLLGQNNKETMGWIRALGVLKSARGRGIGTFLLRTAFAEFARLGRDKVGLGVDTENATGALALYEGVGMTRQFAADTWETRIPAADAATAQPVDAATG